MRWGGVGGIRTKMILTPSTSPLPNHSTFCAPLGPHSLPFLVCGHCRRAVMENEWLSQKSERLWQNTRRKRVNDCSKTPTESCPSPLIPAPPPPPPPPGLWTMSPPHHQTNDDLRKKVDTTSVPPAPPVEEGPAPVHLVDNVAAKLQALVYDIIPSTTAVFSYAIGSRKLPANEQFFVGAQTVVCLLQTTQIKSDVCFITDHVAYASSNETKIV